MQPIDAVVELYEQARQSGAQADIRDFLPSRNDPHYVEAACELVRVDLEYSYAEGIPRALDDYRPLCADLFNDRQWLSQAAFEEYRLRHGAGQCVAPAEYHQRYGIATGDWPVWHSGPDGPSAERRGEPDEPHRFRRGVEGEAEELPVPDATEFPACPSDFLGFKLIRKIGTGTFARVYLARQTDLSGRFVTLKVTRCLTPEPEHLAQLQHTNIVPVFSVHRSGTLQAICMPYFGPITLADFMQSVRMGHAPSQSGEVLSSTWRACRSETAERPCPLQGGSIVNEGTRSVLGAARGEEPAPERQRKNKQSVAKGRTADDDQPSAELSGPWLERFRRSDYPDAIAWIVQGIAAGLTHAHGRGLVHCDLKPANVLLADDGRPMILDFNLAADRRGTRMKNLGGTLPYMAPEHLRALRGGGNVNVACDIYSLGVIFFELLTGELPFPVRAGSLHDRIDRMYEDRNQGPPAVRRANPAVSPSVEAIVQKCLQPDPTHRYQTADELLEDLQCHLADLPCVHAPDRSLLERTKKWSRRHPRLTSTASVAVIASLLLGVLATLWALRGRQVARLHAREQVAMLVREMPALRMALTCPGLNEVELERSVTAARESLASFRINLSQPADLSGISFVTDRLKASDRDRLKGCLRELLYLVSALPLREAHAAGGARDRDDNFVNEALVAIQLARELSPGGAAPRAFLVREAELYAAIGESQRAETLRAAALTRKVAPAPEDRFLSALGHISNRRFAKALPLLRDAAQKRPHDVSVWFLLGNCLVGEERFSEAEGCYTTCIAFQHDSYWPLLHRGLCRLELKKFNQAEADFDRVLELRPRLIAALMNRALARAGHGDLNGAIRDVSSAIDCGGPERAYFLRARFYRRLGRIEESVRDVNTGLKKTPSDEKSWIARGIALLRRDPAKAMEDFRQALVMNPTSLPALQNIAAVLSRDATKTKEALTTFDRILALRPDYTPAVAGRGVILARMGKRPEAHRQAVDALASRQDAKTLYQVACIYALTSRLQDGDKRESRRMLARALRKDARWAKLARTDPDLEAIRNDAECIRLLRAADNLLVPE